MLMRFFLVGIVVGGPGVPGQHVDKADLVRRIRLCTDRLEPRYTSLIAAERRAVPSNEAAKPSPLLGVQRFFSKSLASRYSKLFIFWSLFDHTASLRIGCGKSFSE